jgi:hypothetical protein
MKHPKAPTTRFTHNGKVRRQRHCLVTFAQSPERMRRIGSTSHCATAVMLLARIHKKMAPDHKTGSPRLF